MYLHLGENIIVPLKQIIGIFDIQCCKKSILVQEFTEKKQIKTSKMKKIKSLILTDEQIYLSPVSVMTLLKREKDIFREIT
ncbi:MAG: DUF370 domain-containing protein [Clostridia bacterium]|nr:DUF370 domain-containing protein [Clostridia bacterium]